MNQNKNTKNTLGDLVCLTGLLTDKEMVHKYQMGIATARIWKSKDIYDTDSWRRIVYEMLLRYVPTKDEHRSNPKMCNSDVKRNLTSLEFGEKHYGVFRNSPKLYKSFIVEMIERTPPKIFKSRIDFIRECIHSIDESWNQL